MTGPYKRAPRLKVDGPARHQVEDNLTVGSTRWIIRSIHGQDVVLEASSASPGIIWRTTLDKLPAPTTKEHS